MKKLNLFCWALALSLIMTASAFAGETGMPWEAILQGIVESLTGPVARLLGTLAIVVAGLAFAFTEGGSFLRKALGVVLGLSIAFAASTFFLDYLGAGSGHLIEVAPATEAASVEPDGRHDHES